jgi:hypothetical protein
MKVSLENNRGVSVQLVRALGIARRSGESHEGTFSCLYLFVNFSSVFCHCSICVRRSCMLLLYKMNSQDFFWQGYLCIVLPEDREDTPL